MAVAAWPGSTTLPEGEYALNSHGQKEEDEDKRRHFHNPKIVAS
jgi:hypothetical protein